MSTQVKAALRAAVWQAIATFGEKVAREIVEECFRTIDNDHWGRTGSPPR